MNLTWPVVGLVAIVTAAFVAIFALIPETDATSRSALLTIVIGLSNAVVILVQQHGQREVRAELADAKKKLAAVQRTVDNGNGAA
jgi:hypothetical protein